MSADLLKELTRLVGQASDEVVALRKEKVALEKRVDTLSRDLKARTSEARQSSGWEKERAELTRRIERLVRHLDSLDKG